MIFKHPFHAIGSIVTVLVLASTPGLLEAQDTTMARDSVAGSQANADTSAQDSLSVGSSSDSAAIRNPAGYRGMERDTTMFPPGSDSAAADPDATSRTNQRARQDSIGQTDNQNPPGYRGMERPAALDSTRQASDTGMAPGDSSTSDSGKADTTTTETR
jgi:hypothetical protein